MAQYNLEAYKAIPERLRTSIKDDLMAEEEVQTEVTDEELCRASWRGLLAEFPRNKST